VTGTPWQNGFDDDVIETAAASSLVTVMVIGLERTMRLPE